MLIGLLPLVLLLITAPLTLATIDITDTKVSFDVDYGDFVTENQNIIQENFQFSVANSNPSSVTINIVVINLPSGYAVPVINPVTIAAGQSATISAAIDVPHKQDAGERQIATLEIKDSTSSQQYDSIPLIQKTNSMLELDEITVEYYNQDGNSEKDTFTGDTKDISLDEEVQPGSEVTISFKNIKNEFDSSYDSDFSEIDSVTLTVDPDDSDLINSDFETEQDISRIDAGNDRNFDITFNIGQEVEEGDYVLSLEIQGEDGKGATHSIKRDLTITVKRNRDELRIVNFSVDPENPSACEKNLEVNYQIKNYGSRSQTKGAVQLSSSALGILSNQNNLKLGSFSKKDDTYSGSFDLDLSSQKILPGKYSLELTAFINDNHKINSQKQVISLSPCNTANTTNQTSNSLNSNQEQTASSTAVNNDNNKENVNKLVSRGQIVTTVEDPYTSEDILVSLIIISIVLLLAVVALFTVILIKNNKAR